jgi:cytochrome c
MRAQFYMLVVPLIAAGSVQPATAQGGDAENGKDLFKVCRPCHQVGPDAKNGIGPTLNGIVGSKAGIVAGFAYSDPNRQARVNGLVWTDDNLFKFLENPATVMPGNKMTYSGMKDEVDRRDLIAYLRQQSKK